MIGEVTLIGDIGEVTDRRGGQTLTLLGTVSYSFFFLSFFFFFLPLSPLFCIFFAVCDVNLEKIIITRHATPRHYIYIYITKNYITRTHSCVIYSISTHTKIYIWFFCARPGRVNYKNYILYI